MVNTPPPGTAIQPAIGNNQNIQPGLNQSVQPGFQQPLNSQLNNQTQMPTNSGYGVNGQNMYNKGYGRPVGTNNLPMWRTNYLPSRDYPTNLPVRPGVQGQ
jgi:hypothetical protein